MQNHGKIMAVLALGIAASLAGNGETRAADMLHYRAYAPAPPRAYQPPRPRRVYQPVSRPLICRQELVTYRFPYEPRREIISHCRPLVVWPN